MSCLKRLGCAMAFFALALVQVGCGGGDDSGSLFSRSSSTTGSGPGGSGAVANRPPVAAAQTVAMSENKPAAITLTGSDPDGDALTYEVTTQPAHGSLAGIAPNLTYTPATNYSGPDSFTFRVKDASLTSAPAAVSITATAVNHPPSATAQSIATAEDTVAAITLAGADPEGDALTYEVTAQPAHGTLAGTAPSLTYTPAANYSGPDSFTFAVKDSGLTSTSATVSFTVTAENDAPSATAQDITTAENDVVAITLSGSDPESDALTYEVTTQPAHGTLAGTAPSLIYAPAADYNGADSFTFAVKDASLSSAPATVSITIAAVNHAPSATAQSVTTAENTPVAIALTGSDPEGDAITYQVTTQPMHGTLTDAAPSPTYTPVPNYNGPDSFSFTASDASSTSQPATVSITVMPVNQGPATADDQASTREATPVGIAVLANDSEPDSDPLTATVVQPPTNGTATANADGTVAYAPNPGFYGTDSFGYAARDPAGEEGAATVSVEVSGLWYKDQDGDGYSDGTTTYALARPAGHVRAPELDATNGDCDDGYPLAHPGASEVCDRVDNNCDGRVDEGCTGLDRPLSGGDTVFTVPRELETVTLANGLTVLAAKDEVLVTVREDITSSQLAGLLAALDALGTHVIGHSSASGVLQLRIPETANESDLIAAIEADRGVAAATLNMATALQTGISYHGGFEGDWWIEKVKAPDAWSYLADSVGSVGIPSARVGIVDDGLNPDIIEPSRLQTLNPWGRPLTYPFGDPWDLTTSGTALGWQPWRPETAANWPGPPRGSLGAMKSSSWTMTSLRFVTWSTSCSNATESTRA